MQMPRNWWFLPLFSVALGVACLTAFWLGGNPGDGLFALGVMSAAGLLIAVGGRSETIRGLLRAKKDLAEVAVKMQRGSFH